MKTLARSLYQPLSQSAPSPGLILPSKTSSPPKTLDSPSAFVWFTINFNNYSRMQNYRMFNCYTLTNSFSSLEICARLIFPIVCCCVLFVCLFGICCCWGDGAGRGLMEILVSPFVCGLLVIVIEELICLFPRPAGRPLPGLMAMLALLMSLVGASKSTAMMSFTELMMSFLIGCSCLTDRINCFLMWT